MKVPRLSQLRKLNQTLETRKGSTYLRILRYALVQWARVSEDKRGLGLLRSRQFPALLAYADALVDSSYPTAALHFAAHQLAALIRKYPWDPSVVQTDPERKAIETFVASEHRCKRMNQWFNALGRNFSPWSALLSECRSWIRYVITDAPDMRAVYDEADFTGGASIGVHGDATNLKRKLMADRWSVTPTALPYFAAAMCHNWTYAKRFGMSVVANPFHVLVEHVQGGCSLVSANKVAFVPKTAKTFRSIAVEPLANGYLQKGIDLHLRHRLKRVGIDLRYQSLNQAMAHQGSLSESEDGFCTIDLSSASDSISIGLVRELLPPAWFDLLNRVRSPSYELQGAPQKRYEKFCSMGNGFCFPLQTLLFASICHASGCGEPGKDFMVYGDDIIVRKKFFAMVVAFLARVGFKTNVRKTFAEGPFRESCGANWYKGEDVTPFTLDFELDDLRSLFKFANLARRNERTNLFLSECIRYVISLIPDPFRFVRPFKGPADTGIDPIDMEIKYVPWGIHKGYQCAQWLELHTTPVTDGDGELNPHSWVVMAAALRGHPSERPFTFRRKTKMRVRVIARSGDESVRPTWCWEAPSA